jgi:hypothetical protein
MPDLHDEEYEQRRRGEYRLHHIQSLQHQRRCIRKLQRVVRIRCDRRRRAGEEAAVIVGGIGWILVVGFIVGVRRVA